MAGTKAIDVTAVLAKIPEPSRQAVKEVTLDMSNAMNAIIRSSFPNAAIVTDRFHVQQLISEAVQEIRITLLTGVLLCAVRTFLSDRIGAITRLIGSKGI